jgi:peptide-methionine (S)-S-oxide reductase
MTAATGTATLGGGCFWCLEAVYQEMEGVGAVRSGYAGGRRENPTYAQVSTGATGHAEVVQLTYDPQAVSFRSILEVFFSIHDPTTPDRQGADVGSQYRSVIFTHSEEQEATARQMIGELDAAGVFPSPVVTEVTPFEAFYPAEDYHQNYYRDRPEQPYCQIVIDPKIRKFRARYFDRLRKS